MCENEIQIEIEKGNPKTIMNLNNKKNLIKSPASQNTAFFPPFIFY